MTLYRAPAGGVQPVRAAAQARAGVVCRCCPGGISRSRRARRYPSDMTDAEWAVCEPLLPAPAWLAGRGGRAEGEAYARKLSQAGVPVTQVRYGGTIHEFVVLNPITNTPAPRAAIAQAASYLRSALTS